MNNNELTGPVLPDRWSIGPAFASLVEMQVGAHAALEGGGSSVACAAAAAMMRTSLRVPAPQNRSRCTSPFISQLAGNRFSGTYPYSFALTNTSFANVLVMCAHLPAARACCCSCHACQ